MDRLLFVLDPQLVRHLTRIGLASKHYAWPLISSLFSTISDRRTWLHLLDNMLVQPGTQRTCFTSTKVQTLTPAELAKLQPGTQRTCFTSTKVQTLTPEELAKLATSSTSSSRCYTTAAARSSP